jgi:hypothetical protein
VTLKYAISLLRHQLTTPLLAPESPRWLLLKDRTEEALKVVARLQGRNVPIDDPAVVGEFLSIQTALREERLEAANSSWKDTLQFKDKTQNFRRLLLSCGTQLMQQFSGVSA